MINLHKPTQTDPPIVPEVRRDDYQINVILRHRRNWRKLTPEQRSVILLAGAEQLESFAQQMREEATETK